MGAARRFRLKLQHLVLRVWALLTRARSKRAGPRCENWSCDTTVLDLKGALMLGTLSILTFWMFGLGILLGAAAIGTALAARRPDTPGHDPGDNTAGVIGILTGIAGIAFGVVFLTAALPHL